MTADQGLELSSPVTTISSAPTSRRIIITGDPGVGKTTLALTAPAPFVIDFDGGLEGDAIEGREGGLIQTPGTYRDLEALFYYLRDHGDDFSTIVFDSLDGMIRLLLNEVLDQGKGKDTSKQKQTKSSYALEVVPEQAEYLANQKQVERILTDFRRLGKDIIVTSAIRTKDGEKRCMDVAPGLKTIINRWASIIGELVVMRIDPVTKQKSEGGQPTRVLFVDPSSSVRECKSRWSALGGAVIEPDLAEILNITKGVNN